MEIKARGHPGLAVRADRDLVRQLVASLSGGQRQTVAIAKSVLWNSKVVMLDEPTAALGVAQTRQVLDLVRRLADNGLGVLLISHNMNDVKEVSDRISALYLGRMAADVPRTDVTTPRDHRTDHHRPVGRPRPGPSGCAGVGMTHPGQSKAVKPVSDEKARGMFSGDAAGPVSLGQYWQPVPEQAACR